MKNDQTNYVANVESVGTEITFETTTTATTSTAPCIMHGTNKDNQTFPEPENIASRTDTVANTISGQERNCTVEMIPENYEAATITYSSRPFSSDTDRTVELLATTAATTTPTTTVVPERGTVETEVISKMEELEIDQSNAETSQQSPM